MKIYKIKKDQENKFLEWGEKLSNEFKEEAIQSLREENCTREMFYLFKIGEDYFAAGHMEGSNIKPSTDTELNREHKKILKECLDDSITLSEVYNLKI